MKQQQKQSDISQQRQRGPQPLHPCNKCSLNPLSGRNLELAASAKVYIRLSTWPHQWGPAYTAHLNIYVAVVDTGVPNFQVACISLPSNLKLTELHQLVHTQDDASVVEFLEFGFPTGYEGQVLTPDTSNLTSSISHPQDLATYITKVKEGTVLNPFDNPLSPLGCANKTKQGQ